MVEIMSPQNEPARTSTITLDGRRAVVTGAALGIGAAIATLLAEAGATVMVTDMDPAGEQTASDLAGRGLDVSWQSCNVTNTADLIAVGDAAVAAGGLDIWINNAGIYPTTGPVLDVTDEFLARMFDVNVRAQFSACREAGRRLSPGGAIVNLASIAAIRGGAGISAYSASKAAVVAMTRALSLEFGPKGIRVNAIAPGVIDTPGVRAQMEPLRAAGVDIAKIIAGNSLGIAGQPEHIAKACLFLVSDLASFVNGHLLVVDGGATA
jgi:NAD(P)-dependent dehydrogenase (short-subunit alcohol dehydrogenase family)